MSDIKLFRLGDIVHELSPSTAVIERSLQELFERNLEKLLGIRFLASEFSTGPVHGGRIDTLGIDEDGTPVIIEYKRSLNENVINQGLFYLDWLMDHRKDFQWLVMDKLGQEVAGKVDWSSPRLLCIAGDFTRYDSHAVKQINRSIELIRYRRFDSDYLMIELVHTPRQAPRVIPAPAPTSPGDVADNAGRADPYLSQRIDYRLQNASPALRDVWDAASTFLTSMGDDVQVKPVSLYYAFKRIRNFVCMELYPQKGVVLAFLKLDPTTVAIEPGFTRDVRTIGHFGTGDLEVVMRTVDDVAKAMPLFQRAYEQG